MPQTTNSKFENYLWTKNSSIAFIALDSLWMEVAKKCAKFVVFLIWNLNFAKTTGYVSSIIVWVNVLVLLRSWTTFRYCGLFLRTETLCGEVGRYCMFVWMILMNFVWMIDSVLTFCCNKVVHWDLGWKIQSVVLETWNGVSRKTSYISEFCFSLPTKFPLKAVKP